MADAMELKCDICGNPSLRVRRLTDDFMIQIGLSMGIEVCLCLFHFHGSLQVFIPPIQAHDLFCDPCFNVLSDRCDDLTQFKNSRQSQTLNTLDANLTRTQELPPESRSSELTLSSPRVTNSSTVTSSASTDSPALHPPIKAKRMTNAVDSVDRLVNKRPRVDRKKAHELASQSLSVENASTENFIPVRTNFQKSLDKIQDSSSLSSSTGVSQMIAPMPKDRPMRKGHQWATGRFSPPLSKCRKIIVHRKLLK